VFLVTRALGLAAGVGLLAAATPSFAESLVRDRGFDATATLAVDSVGVFRGIKSRRLNPSVYAEFEIARGPFYGGLFAQPVGFEGETVPLLYGYAGWTPSAFGFFFDLGAGYYAFPGSAPHEIDVDHDGLTDHSGKKELFEPYAGFAKEIGPVEAEFFAFYTPSNFGRTGDAWYYAGDITVPVAHGFDFVAHYGASEFQNDVFNDDYADYFVGVEKSLWGFDFTLKYSNAADLAAGDEEAVVFSVEREFTLASGERRMDRRMQKVRNDFVIDKSRLRGVR
jgi:uncharacterized protein (TIGR02001 family)